MTDVFQDLPSEIRIEVLKYLPLPSVYAATRAFLSLCQTFNAFPTDTIHSATQQYPHTIQRCIWSGISSASPPRSEIPLCRFLSIQMNEVGLSKPPGPLTLGLARRVLQKAWQIHWATQACLKTLAARIDYACHDWTNKDANEPPAPISWVEEHRVLRAYWRIQLAFDVSEPSIRFHDFYACFRPLLLSSCRVRHQIPELDAVVEYEVQKCVGSEIGEAAVEPDSSFTKIQFSENLVEPTWALTRPGNGVDDFGAFKCGQCELCFHYSARGLWYKYHLGGQKGHWTLQSLSSACSYFGCEIWDKRRMVLLGLSDAWKSRIGDLFNGKGGCDSATLFERWARIKQLGKQMQLQSR